MLLGIVLAYGGIELQSHLQPSSRLDNHPTAHHGCSHREYAQDGYLHSRRSRIALVQPIWFSSTAVCLCEIEACCPPLTPSSRRGFRCHHRRFLFLSCGRLRLPLRPLPRPALGEKGDRQPLSDQKGLSRGILDVFSACPMVRPMIEVARRNQCQAATSLEPEFFPGHVSRQKGCCIRAAVFSKLANNQQHSQQCDYHDHQYGEHDAVFTEVTNPVWPSFADEMIHLFPHSQHYLACSDTPVRTMARAWR